MIEIHLYGILKKKFDPKASFAEDTVISIPHVKNESFLELLKRLDFKQTDCGDCFINGKVANETTVIPEGARVGLFPLGMHLLCGGQHLKGHGFISKKPTINSEYY